MRRWVEKLVPLMLAIATVVTVFGLAHDASAARQSTHPRREETE
jgi:hypothetical protein